MKNILSPEAMADWCDTKGVEEYDYANLNGCAGCQYFRQMGFPVMRFGGVGWEDYDGKYHVLPRSIFMALVLRPWTYAALARRLREAAS